ncbi:peptidase activity protein [Homalodisca vitripennis]|nr:peptidase activity protein [Homalodisca vitripennis]
MFGVSSVPTDCFAAEGVVTSIATDCVSRVGCDLEIGSGKKVDECGVCGGDGASCAQPLYHWAEAPVSLCSVSCGGGYKMSQAVCRNRVTGADVDAQLCNASQQPEPQVVECNSHRCPPNVKPYIAARTPTANHQGSARPWWRTGCRIKTKLGKKNTVMLTSRNVHHGGRPSAERKSEGSLRPRMMER